MKKTVYTVPEGYFEQASSKALASAAKIRTRRHAAIAGILSTISLVAVLAVVNPFPGASANSLENLGEEELAALVEIYESDCFLSDNF